MTLFTDIGKDIDDSVAIVYAIIKKLPISPIITTSRDSHKAAIIVKNIINSMTYKYPHIEYTNVMYGSNKPLKGGLNHGVIYSGLFIEGFYDIQEYDPSFNQSTIYPFSNNSIDDGGSIVISPLTDYLGLLQNGSVTGTIFMGLPKELNNGIVEPDPESYNFKCDLYASYESFKYQDEIPFVFIGKDCAYKVPFTRDDFEAIGDIDHPVAKFLKDHAFQTFEHFKSSVPELYEKVYKGTNNMSYCYDPLTMLYLTNPELFTFKNVGHHKIATGIDGEKAKSIIISTIIGGLK